MRPNKTIREAFKRMRLKHTIGLLAAIRLNKPINRFQKKYSDNAVTMQAIIDMIGVRSTDFDNINEGYDTGQAIADRVEEKRGE